MDAITLWRQIAFSTKLAEEAHSSGAHSIGAHPGFTTDSLQAHAGLHQVRALFLRTKLENLKSRLDAQRAKLDNLCPEKCTGRNLHFRDQIAARSQAEPGSVTFKAATSTMEGHAADYDTLSRKRKLEYDHKTVGHVKHRRVIVEQKNLTRTTPFTRPKRTLQKKRWRTSDM